MALQTGILVAFTQLIPEHQVQVFGVLKVRVKVSSYKPAGLRIINPTIYSALANGICYVVNHHGIGWFPVSMDQHTVWLASCMGVPPIL